MARKQKKLNRRRRVVKTALLVVGEGPDDRAFIQHMSREFRHESLNIRATIKNESGGSPGNIITNATRKYQSDEYDWRYIVLDSDLPVDAASKKKAEKNGYRLIFWCPQCLEGTLLDILGENIRPGESSQELKARLHPRLAGKHTEPESYAQLFPKKVLVNAQNASIQTIHGILTGQPHGDRPQGTGTEQHDLF